MAGPVAQPADAPEPPRGLARLRLGERWRNLHGSLENLERNHFDGNFLQAVGNAPRAVGERAGRLGEELGAAAAKLVEEAQGRPPEEDKAMAPAMSLEQFLQPASPQAAQEPPKPREPPPPYRSPSSLWEECERLQANIAEEREMRRGRSLALNAIDEAIRAMSSEIKDEKKLLMELEDSKTVSGSRLNSVEVTLEELQEEHARLLSRQALLAPELQRLADAAAARARAERQATREGAWAREGPETEALMLAKLELAELLSSRDEAQLASRREEARLSRELEAAKGEGDALRAQWSEGQPRRGLKGSVLRLLATARGREPPGPGQARP